MIFFNLKNHKEYSRWFKKILTVLFYPVTPTHGYQRQLWKVKRMMMTESGNHVDEFETYTNKNKSDISQKKDNKRYYKTLFSLKDFINLS